MQRLLATLATVRLWRRHWRTRADLALLDGRLLADIGCCARRREWEIAKSFWQ